MSKKKKQHTKKSYKRVTNPYTAIFFALMAVYFLLMVFVCAIPNSAVEENIMESIAQIQKNGLNPRIVLDEEAYKIDTFTDAIMLNMSFAVDSSHPLSSAIEANQQIVNHSADVFNNIKAIQNGSNMREWSYGRYWHGWMVPVRTLLVFFSYNEIRYLNTIILLTLLTIFLVQIYQRLGKKAFFAFLLGFALINFWIVPLCLHYSSVFYIALIAGIVLFFLKKERFGLVFFIAGSLTSFMDLLSAPIVTLGVPLITAFLLTANADEKVTVSLKRLAVWCALWASAYLFTWFFKFMILAISGQQQVLQESFESIALRSGSVDGSSMKLSDRFYNIVKNAEGLSLGRIGGILSISGAITAISILFSVQKKQLKTACILLIIGCIPFIWYIVIGNHSSVHIWFTYRTLLVFLIAFIMALLSLIDVPLLKQKYKLLKQKIKKPA